MSQIAEAAARWKTSSTRHELQDAIYRRQNVKPGEVKNSLPGLTRARLRRCTRIKEGEQSLKYFRSP